MKMQKLMLSILLMTSCVILSNCASHNPDIYIKGIDYDDGINNNTPQNKNTWMWITYNSARKRLHWLNNK